MNRLLDVLVLLLLVTMSVAAFGGGTQQAAAAINPADFQTKIDNPLFPLSSLAPRAFEGEERDPDTNALIKTRVESTVLPTTDVVDGVQVLILQEKDFQNGELVEATLDYFAQQRNGDVYYFGERVDLYTDGQITGHQGQWLAGEGNNEPGVAMPAHPKKGQKFNQENAPGVAEDQLTVQSLTERITVPAGSFTGCLRVADFNPLDNETEHKWFCPGAGMVHEEFPAGHLDLVSVESATPATATPAAVVSPTAAAPQPTATPPSVVSRAPGTGSGTGSGGTSFVVSALGMTGITALIVGLAAAGIGRAGRRRKQRD